MSNVSSGLVCGMSKLVFQKRKSCCICVLCIKQRAQRGTRCVAGLPATQLLFSLSGNRMRCWGTLNWEYLKRVKSFQEVEAVCYGRLANCLYRSPAACCCACGLDMHRETRGWNTNISSQTPGPLYCVLIEGRAPRKTSAIMNNRTSN